MEEKEFDKMVREKAQHTCPKCGDKAYEAKFPGGVANCLSCGHAFRV